MKFSLSNTNKIEVTYTEISWKSINLLQIYQMVQLDP
jgi:hypothetical protein